MIFGSPVLIFWDSLRILAAVAALITMGMTPFALRKPDMTWHQRGRFVGSGLICVAIVGAYLSQLGTVPQQWWRTVLVVVGAVMGCVCLWGFLRQYVHRGRRRAR